MRSIAISVIVSLSVCFWAVRSHICKSAGPNFTEFSIHVTLVVAKPSSDGSAICYVLPVLWITACIHIIERISENQDDAYVSSCSPGGSTGATSAVSNFVLFIFFFFGVSPSDAGDIAHVIAKFSVTIVLQGFIQTTRFGGIESMGKVLGFGECAPATQRGSRAESWSVSLSAKDAGSWKLLAAYVAYFGIHSKVLWNCSSFIVLYVQ